MLVTGGRVFTETGFVEADVRIQGAHIACVQPRCEPDARAGEPDARAGELGVRAGWPDARAGWPDAHAGELGPCEGEQVIDATGMLVCPGLVDLHFHGCAGHDFCDGTDEAVAALASFQASRGVTAICPATMTFPEERLATVMRAAERFRPAPDQAQLVGVNMEGPFISPKRVGAQNPAYVQPCDIGMLRRLNELSGELVKLVDVAPEEPGALAFIGEVARSMPSVRVSLAHTCADYECARKAFEAGARQMTHLFNAMPGLGHRAPGPIAAAAERDDVVAEVIADGVHVHPAMVRLAFRLFGSGRVALISDSMRACGLGDGTFDLGGQPVNVHGKEARLADGTIDLGGQPVNVHGNEARLADGTIAGSVTDLAACVRTAVREMGIDPWSAVRAASETPARALGLYDLAAGGHGRLSAGAIANVVLFDNDMQVRRVILRGVPLPPRN